MVEALRGWLSNRLSCRHTRGRQPHRFGRGPAHWVGRGPAHDVGLDHEVVSTTNHHKMFDIVTADEDDASFSVDRERFDYCYPRWCIAAAEPVEHVLSPPQRMPVREAIWRCLANVPMSTVFPRGHRGGSTPSTSS